METELINKNFNDCYFSNESGYHESEYVFIKGNNLRERLNSPIKIGETGFGTGLNLLVLDDFLNSSKITNLNVIFTSVEKFPLLLEDVKNGLSELEGVSLESLHRHISLYSDLINHIKNGWNDLTIKREWGILKINLFIGDIIDSFNNYPEINNCWFFDGHSPDKNPEMWSPEVFKLVVNYSEPGTTFATFTAAGIVKRALREAGFHVKRIKGFGKKRHMINGIL